MAKAGSVKRHLRRVIEKRNTGLQTFLEDIDRQESVLFNLQMAVQNCIDIAAHIIGEEGFGVPGSTSEMFYLLEENGYLDRNITEKMIKAVGLRNLIVHEYSKIDLAKVFEIAQNDIEDLNEYLIMLFNKLDLTS
ncbi:MAG: DUF86 domain-containing protein [Desulfobacterales bacterium]|nr:DUF86 domain-containing protein [Desulfobacterales bacterium]